MKKEDGLSQWTQNVQERQRYLTIYFNEKKKKTNNY